VEQRFRDFIYFSQRQYDCLDYDPFHPTLHHLQKGMSIEAALWSSTLYMAWYNIGSSHVAFSNCDPLKMPPDWCFQLPVGVQRRNLRGGQIRTHLEDFICKARKAGSIKKHLTARFFGNVGDDWGCLKANVQSVWGNGRWSTYTTSELYQKVNRLPVLPNEIGNDGSTGPRTGLCYMYGLWPPGGKKVVPILDRLANQFFWQARDYIRTSIPYLPRGHYDLGMVESQLCDFNSLRKGRYYIGRDIDRDQERINGAAKSLALLMRRSKVNTTALDQVWEARAACFERRYLGEYSGWAGRTEYAKRYYLKTGKVADHWDIQKAMRNGNLF
jgi:hypothetical protein